MSVPWIVWYCMVCLVFSRLWRRVRIFFNVWRCVVWRDRYCNTVLVGCNVPCRAVLCCVLRCHVCCQYSSLPVYLLTCAMTMPHTDHSGIKVQRTNSKLTSFLALLLLLLLLLLRVAVVVAVQAPVRQGLYLGSRTGLSSTLQTKSAIAFPQKLQHSILLLVRNPNPNPNPNPNILYCCWYETADFFLDDFTDGGI